MFGDKINKSTPMTPKLIYTIILAATLCSCGQHGQQQEKPSLMEASRTELATALAERDQLLMLVKDISAGMEQIRQLEGILMVANAHPQENVTLRTQIIPDLAALRQTLRQRREQLTALESRMQKSTLYSAELQSTIDMLRKQIDSQSHDINALRSRLTAATDSIGILSTTLDSLTFMVQTSHSERDAAKTASMQLEHELNTCYYIIASKADLKAHKILETGFLRKTKLLKGEFDQGFFITGDKRDLDTIHINSSKAKILTSHPEKSFRLTEHDGHWIINITSPDRFWGISNYLVVQTD